MKASIKDTVSLLFHTFAFVHHMYATVYPSKAIDINTATDQRIIDAIIFTPVFGTAWNLAIQSAYFVLAACNDILRIFSVKQELKQKIDEWNGFIFTTYLFPTTLYVSTVFWGIYHTNREWIFPEVLDAHIPGWLNHFLHTNILAFLVIEFLLTDYLTLPTIKSAVKGISIAAVIYHIAFLIAYLITGRWAYGIFQVMTWPERFLFLGFNHTFVAVSVVLGIELQTFKRKLNSSRLKEAKKVT